MRDNSALQTISSTTGDLREVILQNGVTSSHSATDPERVQNKGNLSVQGGNGVAIAGTDSAALPDATPDHGTYGFWNLRVIDGSLMTGKLSFDAQISAGAISKYIVLPYFGQPSTTEPVDIVYSGGANDDTIAVNIDGHVLGSRVIAWPNRGDFSFTLNGGAGSDRITVALNNGADADSSAWYSSQASYANLAINAGEGDDIVRKPGAGNAVIDLGAGNDTVYADNNGDQGAAPVASTGPSDNTITGGRGNDLIVLGTAIGANAKLSSNDKVVYASTDFGSDVVRHFTAGSGMGADQLSFTALGGMGARFAGTAVSNVHGAITVQAETEANNTVAEIAALYTDGSVEAAHLFIAYDAGNVGKVYVANDSAAGAVTVTLVGTINLSDTGWSSLVAANFV